MSTSRKRKAEDDDTLVIIKVKGDGTKTVELDARLDVFANGPLHIVKEQIATLYASETSAFQSAATSAPSQKFMYEIFTMFRRLTKPHERPLSRGVHASLAHANLAAMNIFLERNDILTFKKHDWQELTVGFVIVVYSMPTRNPTFSHLHALRIGDVGWGFDDRSCVSLCMHTRSFSALGQYCVYVVARELEVA